MIAGGEDVFEGAAALGEQLAKDPGDATRPATARIEFGVMATNPAAAIRADVDSLSGR